MVTYKKWHGTCRKVWNDNASAIIAHKRSHFTGERNGIVFRFGFEISRNGLSRNRELDIVERTRDYHNWINDYWFKPRKFDKNGKVYRRAFVKDLRALRLEGIRSFPS